jgi:hypothetical protein
MPDQEIDGRMAASLTAVLPLNRDVLAKCLGIARENPLCTAVGGRKNTKSTSYCDPTFRCARQQFFRRCHF